MVIRNGLILPDKPWLLVIHDLMKELRDTAPHILPDIFVHSNQKWTCETWVDAKGHLHMCEADYFALKKMGVPTVFIKNLTEDISLHKVDHGKKFDALNPDQIKQKNKLLLDKVGPEVIDGINEKKEEENSK